MEDWERDEEEFWTKCDMQRSAEKDRIISALEEELRRVDYWELGTMLVGIVCLIVLFYLAHVGVIK